MSENTTKETKAEILNRGFADEISAAIEYLACAAMYGDNALKRQFLQYANDELNHALKLLRLMNDADIRAEQISLGLSNEGFNEKMVEYIANEEAAVFYYDVLEKLHTDNTIIDLCRDIKTEEDLHLRNIKHLFKRAKDYEDGERN